MKAASRTGTVPAGRDVALLAAWAGMVTGFAVFAEYLIGRYVLDRVNFLDPQLVWKIVVAHIVLFVAAGGLLLLLGFLWRPLRSAKALLAVFGTMAIYSALLLVPRMHGIATAVLAAGTAVQAGRMVAPRLPSLRRFMRRSLAAGVSLAALAGIAIALTAAVRERRALAALPAAQPGAPNVLLLIWDTVRALNIGLHGYDRATTPNLDALTGLSIVFDRAFVSAPWTLSSHGTIFTGRWPFDLTASWRVPLDDRHPVIAEVLAGRGYATGGFVANRIFGPPDYGLARGFNHYEYFPLRIGTVMETAPLVRRMIGRFNRVFDTHYSAERRSAASITQSFLAWQRKHDGRPFFAFLNMFDAHEPYNPPSPWNTKFGESQHRRITFDAPPTDGMVRDLHNAYDGGIAYLDDQLRVLLEELERRGVLDNTVVIVTSDHGEHFGEHGLIDHGNSLYAPLLHVPLVIRLPGAQAAGTRVAAAVSLRDIAATINDLAGIDATTLPGRSLARFWRQPADTTAAPEPLLAMVPFAPRQPEWYPLARGDIRSVIVWPWQYIRNGDGSEELYDLENDAAGLVDRSVSDPAALARLRATLDTFPARTTLADPESDAR